MCNIKIIITIFSYSCIEKMHLSVFILQLFCQYSKNGITKGLEIYGLCDEHPLFGNLNQ